MATENDDYEITEEEMKTSYSGRVYEELSKVPEEYKYRDAIPETIRKELRRLAIKTGKPEVYALFEDTLHDKKMVFVSGEFDKQCEYALKQVKKAILSTRKPEGNSTLIKMEFQVLHIFENKDLAKGYVTGVFQTAYDAKAGSPLDKSYFGILTLLDTACEALKELEEGHTYSMDMYVKVRNSFYSLTIYKYTKPEPIWVALPETDNVILKAFKPIQVNDVAKHVGFNRLVQGRILKHSSWKAIKTGKRTGKIEIYPVNSVSLKDKAFTIMCFDTPELANAYKVGSECYFLCDIESSVMNGITGQGRAIIPIKHVTEDIPDIFSDVNEWV